MTRLLPLLVLLTTPLAAAQVAPVLDVPRLRPGPDERVSLALHVGINGTLGADVQVHHVLVLLSLNPILLATSGWLATTLGVGYTTQVARTSASTSWHLDLLATASPINGGPAFFGLSRVSLSVGFVAGLRFESRSGLTLGLRVPFLGIATSEVSPRFTGLQAGLYLTTAVLGLPLLSAGYRF